MKSSDAGRVEEKACKVSCIAKSSVEKLVLESHSIRR